MENYREYLPELTSTTIFQDIPEEALIELLEAMAPPIRRRPAGEKPSLSDFNSFWIILRADPPQSLEPRRFKYDMPKFGEPGMMMAEIPALSRFLDFIPKTAPKPFEPKPWPFALELLEFTPDSLVKFYSEKVAPAQSVFLRNFLGILAQKVMDVRRELFLLKDGRDIFNPAP
ncbi:MAG: hypothetical protein LBR11_07970 [Deltaproteobacteria bacterium]|jgi:hypothetical protein|nr:hypothetical protein [Deltaproteobacteria bacterium]